MSDARTLPSTLEGWQLTDAVAYIESVQQPHGLVQWYPDGPADPWDHVESAMALTIGGRYRAAERAYRWLAESQLPDGSWWAMYNGDAPGESRKETHHTAYVAVGVHHHYRVTGDEAFVRELWPTVEAAIEFALSHQTETGEVQWATAADGTPYDDALVSGCSSIYKSLEAGAALGEVVDEPRPEWLAARARLGEAIRSRPGRFDRTWDDKSRFAMYWFYPVLCGVVRGATARDRLDGVIDRFVEAGLGCRCVVDEPWVTVAETSELVMALTATDRRREGRETFDWLYRWMADDGAYWTGYQFEDGEIWPQKKPTWTAGAAVLAADALGHLTPAHGYFSSHRAE